MFCKNYDTTIWNPKFDRLLFFKENLLKIYNFFFIFQATYLKFSEILSNSEVLQTTSKKQIFKKDSKLFTVKI